MQKLFISGIDTDIGKTIATGMMARYLRKKNAAVITQKIVQTGCSKLSDDILMHRVLMECNLYEQDKACITCPFLFRHPASPHLAAALEGKQIDTGIIDQATRELARDFSMILIEGAGGLMVPLNHTTTILEYIAEKAYPVILVVSSRLGSINHTLLSIEALKRRKLRLKGIVYNTADETDPYITADTFNTIRQYLMKNGLTVPIIEMGHVDIHQPEDIDFSGFFSV